MIKVDLSNAHLKEDLNSYQERVNEIHELMHQRKSEGSDYLGWLTWPLDYDKNEFKRILELKEELKGKYDVLLVCGIGGSYLGARAALETIKGLYPDDGIEVIFIGNTFSSKYINEVLKHIEGKELLLNVISKSGTTTETAISFRIFERLMIDKYGDEAKKRILVTTDKNKGTLKELADKKGYETFVVPDDIGGRYSVFSSVGLLPLALANVDIEALMKGSLDAYNDYLDSDLNNNPAYQYGVARRILDNQGYKAEMFVTYHLENVMFAEWWKQLLGESEGKDGKGILPTSATFSTDLHSLGQFIQQGNGCFFETVLNINVNDSLLINEDKDNLDNMNYLAGKDLKWVNDMAFKGTLDAHSNVGGVPNIVIETPDVDAYQFGYLIYFFFKACAMSCYLLGINPFNQPGVEVYKKKMFALLGKPE